MPPCKAPARNVEAVRVNGRLRLTHNAARDGCSNAFVAARATALPSRSRSSQRRSSSRRSAAPTACRTPS
eukprot:7196969-Alexandrium_andersonii.AAC.1